jgi:hypothetical protein
MNVTGWQFGTPRHHAEQYLPERNNNLDWIRLLVARNVHLNKISLQLNPFLQQFHRSEEEGCLPAKQSNSMRNPDGSRPHLYAGNSAAACLACCGAEFDLANKKVRRVGASDLVLLARPTGSAQLSSSLFRLCPRSCGGGGGGGAAPSDFLPRERDVSPFGASDPQGSSNSSRSSRPGF